MVEPQPTQIAAFSYHFWRIDVDMAAPPVREARKQIQSAIEQLYSWLELPSPFLVQPLRPRLASLLDEVEWFRTQGRIAQSTREPRYRGYADCRSVGGTVTLVVGAFLDTPAAGENVSLLKPAHWVRQPATLPHIGSDYMWGANFPDKLTSGALSDLSGRAFGNTAVRPWIELASSPGNGELALSSVRLESAESDHVLVISGGASRSETATTALATRIAPAAARYRARARDSFDNLYRGSLETRLRLTSELLAEFRMPHKNVDALERQISDLAERVADYGQAHAELQSLRQSVRIDRENLMILLERHHLPEASWFGEVGRSVQIAARQLEAEAAYAEIQFQRAETLMTSLRAQAEIVRARLEQDENNHLVRLGLQLTALGLVVGLGQIIDRDTGKEFVGWLNDWLSDAWKIAESGRSLFIARAALVISLSAIPFGLGWMIVSVVRAVWPSSRTSKDAGGSQC